jgi:hypothetical protein
MGYTYEWSIVGLKKNNPTSLDLTDVVAGTQWKVVATNEDGVTGEFTGATPFSLNTIQTGSFIPYEELTEAIVLEWVKEHVSGSNPMTNYWSHIQSRIEKDIAKKTTSVVELLSHELPWGTGSANYGPAGGPGERSSS